MDWENFFVLIGLWEALIINVFLFGVGIWLITRKNKGFFLYNKISFGWVAIISPVLLILSVLLVLSWSSLKDTPYYTWIISMDILSAVILIFGGLLELSHQNEEKNVSMISKNRRGIFIGLFVYILLLGLSVYFYEKNYIEFGVAYARMRWSFYYADSKATYAMWAFGFLLGFSPHFFPNGWYLLFGLSAPLLFALTGLLWTARPRLFTVISSLHLFVTYIALPVTFAWLIADP